MGRDMDEEEKKNVILPVVDMESSDNDSNIVQIQYIGCSSSTWKITKLIGDNIVPNVHSVSALTTYLQLVPKTKNDNEQMSAVCYVDDVDEHSSKDMNLNVLHPM